MKPLRLIPNFRRLRDGRGFVTEVGLRTAQECLRNHTLVAHNGQLDKSCRACAELAARIRMAQQVEETPCES